MNQDLALDQLVELLMQTPTEEKMKTLLEGLFTPKEIDEILTRLEIVRRLKGGQTQRQIAKDLGVGIATVTRGSIEIQKGRFAYV